MCVVVREDTREGTHETGLCTTVSKLLVMVFVCFLSEKMAVIMRKRDIEAQSTIRKSSSVMSC